MKYLAEVQEIDYDKELHAGRGKFDLNSIQSFFPVYPHITAHFFLHGVGVSHASYPIGMVRVSITSYILDVMVKFIWDEHLIESVKLNLS